MDHGSGAGLDRASKDDFSDLPARTRIFVGREPELVKLRALVDLARAGTPGMALIEGPPGSGKTALVEELLKDLGGDVAVLHAVGHQATGNVTWGVVNDLVSDRPADTQRSSISPTAGSDPLAASAMLLDLVGILQENNGTAVIFVDDAHHADDGSVKALALAVRRLLRDRILMLGTARSGQLPRPWDSLRESVASERILLDGLSPPELSELATRLGVTDFEEAEAQRLHRQTGGNPMHVRQLLVPTAETKKPADEKNGTKHNNVDGKPVGSIVTLVRDSLEHCSPTTLAVVGAAAVLGQRCSLADTGALAGVEDLDAAVEEAIRENVFSRRSTGLEIRFVHGLVHSGVYDSIPVARRRQLHRKAAELTTGTERLRHLVASLDTRDEAVATELEAAAVAELERSEMLLGAQHLRQAAEVGEPGPQAERRMLEAAETFLRASRPDLVHSLAEQVHSARHGPQRDYVLGCMALASGRMGEARRDLERAWDALQDGPPPEGPVNLRGRVADRLSRLSVEGLDETEMRRWLEAEESLPKEERCREDVRWFARAPVLGVLGRAEEGLAEMAASGIRGGRALAARGMLRLWSDDHIGAAADLRKEFARATSGQESGAVSVWLYLLAEAEYRAGDLESAIVHVDLAIEWAQSMGFIWDLPYAYPIGATAYACRGDIEKAEQYLAEAERWTDLVDTTAARGSLAGGRIAVALARDDPHALLQAGWEGVRYYPGWEPAINVSGPAPSEALVKLGRLDEARQSLEDLRRRDRTPSGRLSSQLGSFRVRGDLAAAAGNFQEAERDYAAGEAIANRIQLPIEHARLIAAHGAACAAAGKRSKGASLLEDALERFDRVGARSFADQVRARLRDLNGSPTPPPKDLTPSEMAVGRLIADGHSNKEIASALLVSVKTVEYHVSNLYRKLGVSSRVAIAKSVLELDTQSSTSSATNTRRPKRK